MEKRGSPGLKIVIPMETTKKFVITIELYASLEIKTSGELAIAKRIIRNDMLKQIQSRSEKSEIGSVWRLDRDAKSLLEKAGFTGVKINLLSESELAKSLK